MDIPGSPKGGAPLGQALAHFPQGTQSLALRCLWSQPETF